MILFPFPLLIGQEIFYQISKKAIFNDGLLLEKQICIHFQLASIYKKDLLGVVVGNRVPTAEQL